MIKSNGPNLLCAGGMKSALDFGPNSGNILRFLVRACVVFPPDRERPWCGVKEIGT